MSLQEVVMMESSIPKESTGGRVTHICVSKLTIIGSDDGLSSGQRQAIIWTNARIFFEPLEQTSVKS